MEGESAEEPLADNNPPVITNDPPSDNPEELELVAKSLLETGTTASPAVREGYASVSD